MTRRERLKRVKRQMQREEKQARRSQSHRFAPQDCHCHQHSTERMVRKVRAKVEP